MCFPTLGVQVFLSSAAAQKVAKQKGVEESEG